MTTTDSNNTSKTRRGKKYVGVWVAGEIMANLKLIAQQNDRSLNYVVEKMLARGVAKRNSTVKALKTPL